MPGLKLPMRPLCPAGGKALPYDLQLQDHKPFCLRRPHHALHRQGMNMNTDAATIDTWPAHHWVMAEQISSGSKASMQSHFNKD